MLRNDTNVGRFIVIKNTMFKVDDCIGIFAKIIDGFYDLISKLSIDTPLTVYSLANYSLVISFFYFINSPTS